MLIKNQTNNPNRPRHPKTPQQHQFLVKKNQYHSSIQISFQENHYTFEERHGSLSEPLISAIRHAPLSDQQYNPMYKPTNLPSKKTLLEPDIHVKTKIKHLQKKDILSIPKEIETLQHPEFIITYYHHHLQTL